MKATIGQKLLASYGLIFLLVAGLGVFVVQRIQEVQHSADDVRAIVQRIGHLKDLQMQIADIRHSMTDAALKRDSIVVRNEASRGHQAAHATLDSIITLSRGNDQEIARVEQMRVAFAGMSATGVRMISAYNRSPRAGALVLDEFDKEYHSLIGEAASAGRDLEQIRSATAARVQEVVGGALLATLAGIVATFLVGMAAAVAGVRTIQIPMKGVVARLTSSQLPAPFQSDRHDEIGDIQRAFDTFVSSMRDTILQVGEASSAVASASTEISSSAEQMAAGAQEQSAQTAELAAAMEEMARTISENSRNATLAAEKARESKTAADQGGAVVKQTIEAVWRIGKAVQDFATTTMSLGSSSNQISDITSTIDDIAAQTNLLALNAAIEAARAGEQGRGFAVVADEVRKLAERTMKATKEIDGMVKQLQTDSGAALATLEEGTIAVDKGVTLAEEAGKMLEGIVGMCTVVVDAISQMAVASEEQASTSEAIAKNVDGINSITRESASGIHEMARAADDLNRLSAKEQELLTRFGVQVREERRAQSGKVRQTIRKAEGSQKVGMHAAEVEDGEMADHEYHTR